MKSPIPVTLLSAACLLGGCSNDSDPVALHEEGTGYYIRRYVGVGNGPVSRDDMKKLKVFNPWSLDPLMIIWQQNKTTQLGFYDLRAFEYAVNLEELVIPEPEGVFFPDLHDLTPLSGLKNLKHIDIQQQRISTLTPLTGIVNLEYLNLANNQIEDISPLVGLNNLKKLVLRRNPLSQSQLDDLRQALPNCDIDF